MTPGSKIGKQSVSSMIPNFPSGSLSGVYSTDETLIGLWEDKPLYRKIIHHLDMPNVIDEGTIYDIQHDIGMAQYKIKNIQCYTQSLSVNQVQDSFYAPISLDTQIGFFININNTADIQKLWIYSRTKSQMLGVTEATAIVEYTKF